MRGQRLLRRNRTAWPAVALAGLLAISAGWLGSFRLKPPDRFSAGEVDVTSSADAGPGTLREAILEADRMDGRARILLKVPSIVVETPLPPLVNPDGIVIDGAEAKTKISGQALGSGPLLDVASPNSSIVGVRLAHPAGAALLIRRGGVRLRRVVVEESEVGVYLAADDLVVEQSTFQRNGIAVQLPPAPRSVRIHDNSFAKQRRASIWAVAPEPAPTDNARVEVTSNRFVDDFQSVVVIDVSALLERNAFHGAHDAAVFLSGTKAIIRDNRMRSGRGFGIYGHQVFHAVISGNDVDHNCSGGVLLRRGGSTRVVSNRIFTNGYGIVTVQTDPTGPDTFADNLVLDNRSDGIHVIGGSPALLHNRLLQNERAGVRLSTFQLPGGLMLESHPLLESNVLRGNGLDAPEHDRYEDRPATGASPEALADCSWRFEGSDPTGRAGAP